VSQGPSSPHEKAPRKRKYEITIVQTPSKRRQVVKTPLKNASHPANVDPYDSPSLVRTLFTPIQNKVLGPTPQKDGKVLGLFDLLSEEGENSPLKGQVTVTGPDGEVQGTPRKPINNVGGIPGTNRHSRTPASSGKRFMLDSFATPLKGRNPNERPGKTPSSISKLNFTTPLFLRRDSQRNTMAPIPETGDVLIPSPETVRLPRKPLVRGLSSMLAGLRKLEEEAADDDLDALREIENETSGPCMPVKKSAVLVEDSQVPVLLGGFDDEAMYDSEPEEVKNPILGRDGQPLKIWKKKGQKRTTRRVTIKPVHSKPQSMPEEDPGSPSADPLQNDHKEAVPETQQADPHVQVESGNFDSESGSEYTASEGGTRYRRPNQQKKTKVRTADGKVKTAVRKVGAMAHANFKRLKLRNSGSKGGVAHNNRFRRKR